MIEIPQSQDSVYTLPKKEVDEITSLFKKTELKIKELEQVEGDGLDIPSINQLRYAGYHILKAAVDSGSKEELSKAKNHAKRAFYDAHDAHAIDTLESINQFFDDYRLVSVQLAVPNYVQLKSRVKQITREIQKIPSTDERHSYCDQIEEFVEELRNIDDTFDAARDVINAHIESERTKTRRWVIVVVIALIGVLIKVVS